MTFWTFHLTFKIILIMHAYYVEFDVNKQWKLLTDVCEKKWYFLESFLNNNLLLEPGAHVFNMAMRFS